MEDDLKINNNAEPTTSSWRSVTGVTQLQAAGAIAGVTVFILLGLQAPFVFTKSPLPYMATPGHKVKLALEHIRKSGSKNHKFVDLGSGDGEAVYQALGVGYHKAIGVELNFTMWAFSSMRRKLFWPRGYQSRSRLIWGNFFFYSLEDADTVMIFGVRPLMESISKKIANECRPGTHVLAHRFPLHVDKNGKSPTRLEADIVYCEEDMRIYRCR